MKSPAITSHTWSSEVRDYEVDYQNIVNNAVYMNYLDHARGKYLKDMGFDITHIAQEGINIVLYESQLKFKAPLKFGDVYTVISELSRISQFRLLMTQKIINTQHNQRIYLEAKNYLCCINIKSNKPCLHPAFENMPISPN